MFSAHIRRAATDTDSVVRALILASTLFVFTPLGVDAATYANVGGVEVIVDGAPAKAAAHPHHAAARAKAARAQATQTQVAQAAVVQSVRSAQSALTGQRLVRYAEEFVGTPYVWGGSSPRGFDCSGFTQYVYAAFGIGIPRTADIQFMTGWPVNDPQPGDLLFFQTYDYGASHVAIYIGNGAFVQAIGPSVQYATFNSPYFRSRYLGARRMFPA
jgi:cell wall-associated NlpC family hydrolase